MEAPVVAGVHEAKKLLLAQALRLSGTQGKASHEAAFSGLAVFPEGESDRRLPRPGTVRRVALADAAILGEDAQPLAHLLRDTAVKEAIWRAKVRGG